MGASFQLSFVSLVKTIVGAGLLLMPLAFSTDGIIVGILLIAVAGLTAAYGLFLQVYVSKYVPAGHASFFNVCSVTYPALSVVFDVAIAIQCFGCAVLYLVIVGDLMPLVAGVAFLAEEHWRSFWIAASALVCVPLLFLRNLDSLRYTSMLALGAIAYMAVLVVGHFVAQDTKPADKGDIVLMPVSARSVFSTFSIIVFAFTGHQNMFSVINEAADRLVLLLTQLVGLVSAVAAVLFVVVGLAGYLTFGSNVAENVILLYKPSFLTLLARFAIVFMVVFSFPLMLHPARISVNNIYYWVRVNVFKKVPEADPEASEEEPLLEQPKAAFVPFPDRTFYILTTVLLIVGYAAAISIQSFALVLALVGATGSTAILFILPGLFGYKLIGSEDPSGKDPILRSLSLALVVWGFAVMGVCLYSSLAM